MTQKDIGARIKARRIELRISRNELAERCKISVYTLRNAEQGQRAGIGMLSRIFHELQIELVISTKGGRVMRSTAA